MVIGLHKCSNQKRINAIYVRDFSLLNNTYIHTYIYLIKQVKLHKMAAKG